MRGVTTTVVMVDVGMVVRAGVTLIKGLVVDAVALLGVLFGAAILGSGVVMIVAALVMVVIS